ncbi:hypothetical protein PGT21_024051 [Puccinia graminis f. sp. tritici]|uniref:Uncharacterized protein n=1 Tax=Puccinia graminis f. sp. tritici TaxID=56615 RepID=A0A5B0LY45_PUCGR|nr:hypothetical protein PGT21_024051 [Puccinia graminis f. sp. tritici]
MSANDVTDPIPGSVFIGDRIKKSPNTVYQDRIPRGNLVSVLPKPILYCGPPTLFGSVFNSNGILLLVHQPHPTTPPVPVLFPPPHHYPPPHECHIEGVNRPHLGSNLTTPPLVASVFTHQTSGRTRTRTDTARPPPLVVPGLPSASLLSNLTNPPSSPQCSPNVGSDSDSNRHRLASPTCRSQPALRFVAGYLIWRPPPLVTSPIKRRVGLGLEQKPPGLPHSLFPA